MALFELLDAHAAIVGGAQFETMYIVRSSGPNVIR
jgi:hypothetical protein